MGLRLSADKTRLTHIEEGFEFLGWRIQRRKKKGTRGTTRVYTYPSKKSLASIIDRIRILTRRTAHRTLADLLRRLNPAIRGWCAYFQHGVYQAHVLLRRQLRLPANTRLALQAPPPPEQAHRQPPVPARVAHPGRRNRVLPSLQGPRDPLPLPGNPHPQSPRRRTPRHNTGGEPDAQECARPVRRAAGGNPPAKTRAGRRRPTLHICAYFQRLGVRRVHHRRALQADHRPADLHEPVRGPGRRRPENGRLGAPARGRGPDRPGSTTATAGRGTGPSAAGRPWPSARRSPRWAPGGTPFGFALAEALNSLYKAELIRNKGPWEGIDDVRARHRPVKVIQRVFLKT